MRLVVNQEVTHEAGCEPGGHNMWLVVNQEVTTCGWL